MLVLRDAQDQLGEGEHHRLASVPDVLEFHLSEVEVVPEKKKVSARKMLTRSQDENKITRKVLISFCPIL